MQSELSAWIIVHTPKRDVQGNKIKKVDYELYSSDVSYDCLNAEYVLKPRHKSDGSNFKLPTLYISIPLPEKAIFLDVPKWLHSVVDEYAGDYYFISEAKKLIKEYLEDKMELLNNV